ncbi:MAG: Na/Pi cotransporter family protein [Puniceicoccaceae bacterium]|nr:MAG: Na/Pi cotransporter family protein [Puniceicoccaceae bacterium]
MLFLLLGGIGLFLLGMILLTDGLKSFAGDSLRLALLRFTGRPVTAFCSGATVTAMVQSSSATTLATIGFVSAGLITFPQAIGVIIGASLGTTSTGWIVSTVGLKFSVGMLALPLTGIGAFMRLLGRGRMASLGLALAGFGLIFIGIDTLQEGMRAFSERFDLGRIPASGFWGHLLLLLVGAAMTVVMQSSSAAVATTLAALHTGAIGFEQAASLVIGQAIGTTVTAMLAAIGATVAAKRTAVAHVLFNLLTGLIALLLLPFFLWMIVGLSERTGTEPGAVALAAFHTSFIALGVLIFLPLVKPFSRLVEKIVPERGSSLTQYLDASLNTLPSVALEAVRNCLREVSLLECRRLILILQHKGRERWESDRVITADAVNRARIFLSRVPMAPGEEESSGPRVSLFHLLDHIGSWMALQIPLTPRPDIQQDPLYQELIGKVIETLHQGESVLAENGRGESVAALQTLAESVKDLRQNARQEILDALSRKQRIPEASMQLLDYLRMLDSATYHLSRIVHYLNQTEFSEK